MNNNLRRIIALTAAAVILALSLPILSVCAMQNTITYQTSEYTMTMDVPDTINFVSSSVKKNDNLFYNHTFDYISVMAKIRDDNAVYYGKDKNNSFEFEVTVTPDKYGVKNISRLSQKKLDKVIAKYNADKKAAVSKIYKSSGNTYIYAEYRGVPSASSAYVYEYATVFDNDDISVCFISKTPITDEKTLKLLTGIADSIGLPQKQPLDLKNMEGRGSVVVLFVIISGFFAVIFYRKHEDTLAPKLQKIFEHIVSLLDSARSNHTTEKNNSVKAEIAPTTADENNSIENKDEETQDEDDDLSDIDLDEAIAAFDDRRP